MNFKEEKPKSCPHITAEVCTLCQERAELAMKLEREEQVRNKLIKESAGNFMLAKKLGKLLRKAMDEDLDGTQRAKALALLEKINA